MFFGAVPVDCIQQILRIIDHDDWRNVHVCCSGSFRIETAFSSAIADVQIWSNDVALYSTAIGRYYTDSPFDIVFQNELEFVQHTIDVSQFENRVAGVMVATEMARFRTTNAYGRKMLKHYRDNFPTFAEKAITKLTKLKEQLRIVDYYPGDWRQHANVCMEEGRALAAFPPFFMGDYESQYKWLERNVAWQQPSYDLYDPSMLHDVTKKIHDSGIPYVVLSDQVFEDLPMVLHYEKGRKVPHYCYARTSRSSFLVARAGANRPRAINYDPLDPTKLTERSKLEVFPVKNDIANHVKDVYLQSGIIHSNGTSFLVMIDKKLAGVIVLNKPNRSAPGFNTETTFLWVVELLSDVVINNACKLGKLVAMVGTSRPLVQILETKFLRRPRYVTTIARSNNPVSMKYRGPFKLIGRNENHAAEATAKKWRLAYMSDVREQTPQEIYDDWWQRYGRNAVAQANGGVANSAGKKSRRKRGKRKVHDGPRDQAAG